MNEDRAELDVGLQELLERGRRCVFGYLCPMILHETNNVLTVMAGIRQLLAQGSTLSDRIGPMLDSQLEKMDAMLGWIHGMRSDDLSEAPRDLPHLVSNLDQLIGLAGKGRGLHVQAEGDESPIEGDALEQLSIAALCCVLPLLPQRSAGVRGGVQLRAARTEAGVVLRATVEPCATDPGGHPDLRLAAELIRAAGGTFATERTSGGGLAVELTVPGA